MEVHFFLLVVFLNVHKLNVAQEIFTVNGSIVQLRCPDKGNSKQWINWFKRDGDNFKTYTSATVVDTTLDADLHSRLQVTGDQLAGEYHLNISDVKNSDEGTYKCILSGATGEGSTQQLTVITITVAQETFTANGSTVQLRCPHKGNSSQWIIWLKKVGDNFKTYTSKTVVDINLDADLQSRLQVTGDQSLGEYHLNISDVKKSDEGTYICRLSGTSREGYKQQFTVVTPPSSLYFIGSIDNMLEGREGTYLLIRCLAVGGTPPPDVSILDGNKPSNKQEVSYRIPRISRDYHQRSIVCQASDALGNLMSTTVKINLNLKPLTPIFNTSEVSTEETVPLTISCTSYGSRPAASFTWSIGGNGVTFSSITAPPVRESNDTYTVTSTLIYSVNKRLNKQSIACEASNPEGSVSASKTLDVKYAPDITVENNTFHQSDSVRNITCIAQGNPTTYTYYNWIHLSVYHVQIRQLKGSVNGVLSLPLLREELRYHDIGFYVCTASNSIIDNDGKIKQTALGLVKSIANPVFTKENEPKFIGVIGESVSLNVYVYSEPKYTMISWFRNGSLVTNSAKNTLKDEVSIIDDNFHGTDIQIDGFKISLIIEATRMEDFTNYNLRLSNGIGKPAEHSLILVHGSAPQSPINFTVISVGQTSVTVKWKSADNGGFQQKFYVEYKILTSFIWIQREMPTMVYVAEFQVYELIGLQTSTYYNLRIFAANKVNKSLPSIILTTRTLKLDDEYEIGNSLAVPVFAVGISCMLLTVFALLIKGFICNRRRNTLKTKRMEIESIGIPLEKRVPYKKEVETLRPHNEQSGFDKTSADRYESLGMKDKPNTYSDVKEQSVYDETSAAAYEPLGVTDKPNTYSEIKG